MKATNILPKQKEIEEFLGKEFFPKYQQPITLLELVDLMQLEFQVSDDDRAIPMPNGHGCGVGGRTVFECLVHFALLRLQEKGVISLLGGNTYIKGSARYIGRTITKDVNHVVWQMISLRDICHMDKDAAMIHLAGKWQDDVIEKAAQKVYATL